jgi:3-hydroxybutyryl-CoA dehydrogenase
MQIKKVGIVGCGIMGSGIAQTCIQSGYQTLVSEINDQLLTKGLGMTSANLDRIMQKGKITEEDKKAMLARLKGTTELKDFADCDLIIEAIVERRRRGSCFPPSIKSALSIPSSAAIPQPSPSSRWHQRQKGRIEYWASTSGIRRR